MKKRTVLSILGVAAAGAGAAGGLMALGNALYSAAVAPSPRKEEPVDRYDAQKEGRSWAREGSGFQSLRVSCTVRAPRN